MRKKELRILVIEDDAIHRTVVENILQEEGYEVETAVNGEEGINKAFEIIPDLIITDIRMPVKDGYAVCREIKADPKTQYIPVVILTANSEPDDLVFGFEQGAFDYILKPFDTHELMARVNAAVKFKEIRDELIEEKQKSVLVELAGGAAHELNQPLTILKTTTYLMKEKLKSGTLRESEFDKYITKMNGAIERMSTIVTKMNNLDKYTTKGYAMGQKIINLIDKDEEE